MRLLFLGDIVGRPGRTAFIEQVPELRRRWSLDVLIVNGENAAHGFGITEAIYNDLIDAGADAITLGNHAWDQREAMVFIERAPRLVRPINFPPGTPGKGAAMVETAQGARILVINAMGRLFMDPLDDPFRLVEAAVAESPLGAVCDAIIVDMHAEATSEKQALAWHLDGRASLVIGTHTHAPTADHRILPGGTAYQSDAGMTGNYDSILGFQKQEPIRRFFEKTPSAKLEIQEGDATLCGLAVEIDDRSGLARAIAPVRLGPHLEPATPTMWERKAGVAA
jgi:2',3'-cyclic-nucleotide 2'-phosphodiesterase